MMMVINILVGIIAALHFYFLVLEMFLWTKPLGLRVFNQSLEKAQMTAVLASNQGLYNGFLTAGLIWGLLTPNPVFSKQIEFFFLNCVTVAGIFGAITVSRRILFIQALPAVITIILLLVGAS